MDIEKNLPRKETAERLGISLQQIFDEIKGLSKDDLINAPREFILQGKIEATLLREIRKLGLEFSIAGEKDRLVFATGRVNSVEPNPKYSLSDEDHLAIMARRELRRVIARYTQATYSMHSHDTETGVIPSLADVRTLQESKNSMSLIFTAKGILSYGKKEGFDINSKLNTFLGLKYSSIYPLLFKESSENNVFKFETLGVLLEGKELMEINEKRNKIFEDFCRTFDIIVSEATWENESGCQKIIDNYFEQN